MEDFNQVMMDQLLEHGFQLGEPPLFGVTPPWAWCEARPVNAFFGDLSLEITSKPPDRWRVHHDYALDARDLGAEAPDHSIWLPTEFVRIVVPMAYYSHVRRVTIVDRLVPRALIDSAGPVS